MSPTSPDEASFRSNVDGILPRSRLENSGTGEAEWRGARIEGAKTCISLDFRLESNKEEEESL